MTALKDSQVNTASQSKRMRLTKVSRQKENTVEMTVDHVQGVSQRKPSTMMSTNALEQQHKRGSSRINDSIKSTWAPSRSSVSSASPCKTSTFSNNSQQAKHYDVDQPMQLQQSRSSASGRTSNGSSIVRVRLVIHS
jgi:hypothetical protein